MLMPNCKTRFAIVRSNALPTAFSKACDFIVQEAEYKTQRDLKNSVTELFAEVKSRRYVRGCTLGGFSENAPGILILKKWAIFVGVADVRCVTTVTMACAKRTDAAASVGHRRCEPERAISWGD